MKPTGKMAAAAAVALTQSYHSYQELDCQALIEQAVRNVGGQMDYRGSNDMARNAAWLGTIENAQAEGKLVPGALLFIHEDDESGLPARYQGDGFGDFSHVGIYVGENALTDTNKNGQRRECDVVHSSQSMGRVCGSTLKNGWTHVGWAQEIDYGAEVSPGVTLGAEIGQEDGGENAAVGLTAGTPAAPAYATVRTPDGGPVKLRKSASKAENVYWLVNHGARVQVERRKGEWALVTAICTDGHTRRAWMISAYLAEE